MMSAAIFSKQAEETQPTIAKWICPELSSRLLIVLYLTQSYICFNLYNYRYNYVFFLNLYNYRYNDVFVLIYITIDIIIYLF
jgi:hypothetical protein